MCAINPIMFSLWDLREYPSLIRLLSQPNPSPKAMPLKTRHPVTVTSTALALASRGLFSMARFSHRLSQTLLPLACADATMACAQPFLTSAQFTGDATAVVSDRPLLLLLLCLRALSGHKFCSPSAAI